MKQEVPIVMKPYTALFWYVPVCWLVEVHLAAGNHLTD